MELSQAMAETGDPEGLYWLATMHYNLNYEKHRDYYKAAELYTKSAELGYLPAIFKTGYIYYNNAYIKDRKKGFYWLEKAADQCYYKAISFLFDAYDKSYDIKEYKEQNMEKIRKWYYACAEAGNVDALYWLGLFHSEYDRYFYAHDITNLKIDADNDKAIEFLRKATEKGDLDSKISLAQILFSKKDYIEAYKLYNEAALENNNHAKYALGLMFTKKIGIEANPRKGIIYYEQSAKDGNNNAINALKKMKVKPFKESEKLSLYKLIDADGV